MNLYGFVGNDGVNASDVLGNNAIAIPVVESLWALIEGAVGISAADAVKKEKKAPLDPVLYLIVAASVAQNYIKDVVSKDPVTCWIVSKADQGPGGWVCRVECSNGMKFGVPCGCKAKEGDAVPWNDPDAEDFDPEPLD
jgi:hypothetical protein